MALDATPGGSAANAYVTVAEATVFLQERLNTEPWYATTDTDRFTLQAKREAALIWATRLLDERVSWYGRPATVTQALAWPQSGQVDAQGRTIATTVVPDTLKRATAFYALALLRDTAETPTRSDTAQVRRRRLGDTEIEYWQPSLGGTSPTAQIPADIRQMLRPYGTLSGSVTMQVLRI